RGLSDELLNIKELQELGHHVSIVTADVAPYIVDMKKEIGKGKSLTFQEDKPTEIFGIPVYVLRCTIPQMGWYCPRANRLAKKIVANYDVIHIRNWYHHLAIVFYKAARQYGIPFVFTAHGTMDPVARKKYMRRTKWMIDNLYTKKMIRDAAALHSLGESETKEFIRLGAEPQKIFRIDLGVLLKDFEIKERTDILDRLGVNRENKPYLLFLGRINKKKGIELLLESFARLNYQNLTLVIAGSGDKSYEQKIRQLVRHLGVESSVKFAGSVFGNEKSQLLESAKIFVLTSYSDIHPVAVEEALAMGVPVLITKNCDFPEVEEYDAGILVEPNVDSIYQGLAKMINDENKLLAFSKNAKKLVSEKFLFEGKVKKYEEMYRYAIEHSQ
ncbi:MAG: glycosyltransferase, partial [Nitrosopumilaceae archaeon]